MKKLLTLLSAIGIFALIMTSCRLEDNNNNVVPPKPILNPLVGTWYQVGPYANISTKERGQKVIFTEINVTAVFYQTGYTDGILYDNLPYSISGDEIQILGSRDNSWIPAGYKLTTKFAFNNDTLWIRHFNPTLTTGPDVFTEVELIKEEKIKW